MSSDFMANVTLEKLIMLVPLTVIITGLVIVGGAATWFLMSQHIKTLKEWIDSLQKRNN